MEDAPANMPSCDLLSWAEVYRQDLYDPATQATYGLAKVVGCGGTIFYFGRGWDHVVKWRSSNNIPAVEKNYTAGKIYPAPISAQLKDSQCLADLLSRKAGKASAKASANAVAEEPTSVRGRSTARKQVTPRSRSTDERALTANDERDEEIARLRARVLSQQELLADQQRLASYMYNVMDSERRVEREAAHSALMDQSEAAVRNLGAQLAAEGETTRAAVAAEGEKTRQHVSEEAENVFQAEEEMHQETMEILKRQGDQNEERHKIFQAGQDAILAKLKAEEEKSENDRAVAKTERARSFRRHKETTDLAMAAAGAAVDASTREYRRIRNAYAIPHNLIIPRLKPVAC